MSSSRTSSSTAHILAQIAAEIGICCSAICCDPSDNNDISMSNPYAPLKMDQNSSDDQCSEDECNQEMGSVKENEEYHTLSGIIKTSTKPCDSHASDTPNDSQSDDEDSDFMSLTRPRGI